nr:MAG TPA: tailspike protein [Caudoviricetes sp.]
MSTITQFPSGNTQYRIEFDYLARTFVVVTLVNSSNPALNRVLEVGRDYRFLNPTMIEMLVDQSGFDVVRIHRQTGTDLVVDFRNGSVLTASDLTNAELQAIHIAEEGRDQTVDLAKEYADAAGSSAGNAKDSEDEARRIAESIKESGLIGYITRRSFEKGFNITTWNEVLLWEEEGEYYRWDGALPKAVPVGSTPSSTGGIGLGAWVSVGDASLRSNLIDSSQGKGSSLITFNSGIESRLLSDKLGDIYTAKDAGIVGDGSDETSKLLNLINNRNGRIIDLQGLTVAYSGFAISLTSDLVLTNGKLLYIGTETAFASKINTTALIALKNVKLDGASVAAKGLFLNATAVTARLWVSEYEGTNFRETTTGLAAGLYATADASVYWDEILLDNVRVRDVSNAGIGTNVGRGVMIQNFRYAICTRLDVRRVAPYQDADGIYASSPNYPEAVFVCGNSYFEDCQKRSVKSQVMNSHVFNITEKLTQGFTAGAGQSAVDLQAGGSLNGLTCFYADGAARQSIVAGGFISGATTFRGLSLRNIDVNCVDPTDVIPRMVSLFNNSATTYDGFVVENFKCNCLIENMGYLYSNVGNSQPSTYIFKEVIFRNIQASGFTNSAQAAVIQVSRGTSQYVKAIVRVQNCNLGDGATAPVAYLDPAPGSTSFLQVLYRQIDNCRGFNVKNPANTDTAARVYVQTLDINEDGAGSITVPVSVELGRTSLKVTAMYNSNRDTVGSKLFTEGVWMQGATTGVYIETLPGVKTSTNTGSIAITASGSNVVVTKTGGTTSAGGRLSVIITHLGSI